jgi:hypothetical protein
LNKNTIKITADREDYETCLLGSISIDGFSGFGEGWFGNSQIIDFCSALKKLSTTMSGTAELIGSQCKSDGSDYLETFSLRLYVLSSSKLNGVIGIHCKVAQTAGTDCRKEEIRTMSGELKIRNQHINRFADELEILKNGVIDQVTLNCDLDIF